jgi:hypothetical protein
MRRGFVADVFFLEGAAVWLARDFFFEADIKLRYHPASAGKCWASNELQLFRNL